MSSVFKQRKKVWELWGRGKGQKERASADSSRDSRVSSHIGSRANQAVRVRTVLPQHPERERETSDISIGDVWAVRHCMLL